MGAVGSSIQIMACLRMTRRQAFSPGLGGDWPLGEQDQEIVTVRPVHARAHDASVFKSSNPSSAWKAVVSLRQRLWNGTVGPGFLSVLRALGKSKNIGRIRSPGLSSCFRKGKTMSVQMRGLGELGAGGWKAGAGW